MFIEAKRRVTLTSWGIQKGITMKKTLLLISLVTLAHLSAATTDSPPSSQYVLGRSGAVSPHVPPETVVPTAAEFLAKVDSYSFPMFSFEPTLWRDVATHVVDAYGGDVGRVASAGCVSHNLVAR